MITKTFIAGLIAIFTASVANSAWAGNGSQSDWNVKTKHNPVEQTAEHIATTQVITRKHRYQISFRCQNPSNSKIPHLNIRVIGVGRNGNSSGFQIDTKDELMDGEIPISAKIRIGNMHAINMKWHVSQKYDNEALNNFNPSTTIGRGFVTLGGTPVSPGPIVIARLLRATRNNNIMAIGYKSS